MPITAEYLATLPERPGCYLMKDDKDTVLYVGKAINLKSRIKQYFSLQDERFQVPYLVEQVTSIDTIVVNSDKEALLLENTLIKRYRPKYNVLLKDDKNYLCLKIIENHPYPLMQLARYKEHEAKFVSYFGPYTSSKSAREMFDLTSRVFQLRQCSDEEFARRTRPCLLHQIKRCIAPCVNLCTKEEYQSRVVGAKRLLSGQDQEVIKQLKSEMEKCSEELQFEKAGEILHKIRLIQGALESQRVAAISHSDLDAVGLFRKASDGCITTLMWRDGKLVGSCHYEFEGVLQEDGAIIQSFLLQHYLSDKAEGVPTKIIISQDIEDQQTVAEILSEELSKKITVFYPQMGEKKKLVELAISNAEASFNRRNENKVIRENVLSDLQDALKLSRFPRRIECYDNSHLFGEEAVSALVTFLNGEKYKAGYRKWRFRGEKRGDDYGMLREALKRRFSDTKLESELPDLIIVDGGKGHLNVAIKVLSELDIASCDIISVAKEEGRHDKGLSSEAIFLQNGDEPIKFSPHHHLLHFLQSIRDEAHRFVITFHRLRKKKAIVHSVLDDIDGIGPVKKKRLLQTFKSVQAIRESKVEDLLKVRGITQKDAEKIYSFLKKINVSQKS